MKECGESAPPSVIDTSVVRRKSSRDLVRAKDVKCSTCVHLHIGELEFYEDYSSAQANTSIQHPCRGEGVEFGSVGISADSMSRKGRTKEIMALMGWNLRGEAEILPPLDE